MGEKHWDARNPDKVWIDQVEVEFIRGPMIGSGSIIINDFTISRDAKGRQTKGVWAEAETIMHPDR